jgi:hypothetical protein
MKLKLRIYVNGELRRVISKVQHLYMQMVRPGMDIDLVIDETGEEREILVENSTYVQIGLTEDGKIYVRVP